MKFNQEELELKQFEKIRIKEKVRRAKQRRVCEKTRVEKEMQKSFIKAKG